MDFPGLLIRKLVRVFYSVPMNTERHTVGRPPSDHSSVCFEWLFCGLLAKFYTCLFLCRYNKDRNNKVILVMVDELNLMALKLMSFDEKGKPNGSNTGKKRLGMWCVIVFSSLAALLVTPPPPSYWA